MQVKKLLASKNLGMFPVPGECDFHVVWHWPSHNFDPCYAIFAKVVHLFLLKSY